MLCGDTYGRAGKPSDFLSRLPTSVMEMTYQSDRYEGIFLVAIARISGY